MTNASQFLKKTGIHCFLLPLFFVLHYYLMYQGLVPLAIAIPFLAVLIVMNFLHMFISYFLIKNVNKCALVNTLLSFLLLFYGILKDFIANSLHLAMLAKHRFILPVLLIVCLLLIRYILKRTSFATTNLFLNILLLSFISLDLFSFFLPATHQTGSDNSLVSANIAEVAMPQRADARPDVYFLLFDCYPGLQYIQDYLHYDNSAMEKELKSRKFKILQNPRCNYNRTPFSMASELNFAHLNGLKNSNSVTPLDYTRALATIKRSLVPTMFERQGYRFYNLSIFEIGAQPPIFLERFLSMSAIDMLLFNTCPGRIKADIGWKYLHQRADYHDPGKLQVGSINELKFSNYATREFTRTATDSVVTLAGQVSPSPKFVYAHLMMPHAPYFYDESGRANQPDSILPLATHYNTRFFLQYLRYTNKVMLRLVDSILAASAGKAVIIVQSDHGSIDFEGVPPIPALTFQNISSFYFPDQAYSNLYDSLTNINTFPVLFNKYFKTAIPLQKDSCVIIR